MKIPLQITFHNIKNSEAVGQYIQKKTQKLNNIYSDIASCRVVIEMPHKHHSQGNQFIVNIDLGVPGHQIIINQDHHEDVYVALRDAFDVVKRQLEDYVYQHRHEIKNHAPEYTGYVSSIFKKEGFGFIMGDDGTERYFHRDNVKNPDFEHIKKGDEVKFIEETIAERPHAKRVSVS
jgi:ribosomal subunit interface protein